MIASARWLLAGALVLAGLAPSRAAASPLDDPTLGGAVFTGPVHPHATAVYLNPGALGLASRGTHLYMDGSLRLDRYDLTRHHLVDPSGAAGAASRGTLSTLSPGGTLAWTNIGRTVSLGAALSMVTLEKFIDERDLDGADPGVAQGYHSLGGSHRQYVMRHPFSVPVPVPMPTLAGSYRWSERILFGIGISLRFSSLDLAFLRDTALEHGSDPDRGTASDCNGSPCGIENPAAAERYRVQVDTPSLLAANNLVLNVGVMYQLAQDWWLGLHYQSPPGFLDSLTATGAAEIEPAPRDVPAGQTATVRELPADIIYELPQTVTVGIRGPAFGSFDVFATGQWQELSSHQRLDIRLLRAYDDQDIPEWYPRYRGFQDTITLEAGLEQREGGLGRVGGRIRLETATTAANAVTPMQVTGTGITAALGGEIRLGESLFVSGSYGLTLFPALDVSVDQSLFDPRDRIECVDSRYRLGEACEAAAEGRAIPTAAGSYGRIRHAFRLAIRYYFFTR